MFRFATPIILIGLAITGFFLFTNPLYGGPGGVTDLQAQAASYDEALTNSKSLENERDILTNKYNSIDPDNLSKLQKLLPDNVDNIRLIIEIGTIAAPYGMVLSDVKYSTATPQTGTTPTGAVQGGVAQTVNKNYGIWDLEFSTTGSYANFLNFTKDLEKNLRIVDISSIQFSSDVSAGGVTSSDSYKYGFKIKTYWLKN